MSVVTIITENRKEITKYEYGTDGIHTSAEHEVWENGELKSKTRTEYLNDPLNITGYSQVLKQTETNIVANEETVTTYVIGHQRISQIVVKNGTEQEYYFTFDGHGSTRVLLNFIDAIVQLYSFDAYGNALEFDSTTALTEFLYSGEQFDSKIGQQYLRARYFDPATGRFNQLDPFFGNVSNPQSFHKYLYTKTDPVNGIDPSGEVAIFIPLIGLLSGAMSFLGKTAILSSAMSAAFGALSYFSSNDSSKIETHGGRFLSDKEKRFIDFIFRAAFNSSTDTESWRIKCEQAIGATLAQTKIWNHGNVDGLLNTLPLPYIIATYTFWFNSDVGAITLGKNIYFNTGVFASLDDIDRISSKDDESINSSC
ncbi:MAG: RHS repeat-associated core domain-containing protein [Planctomycetaceae bacterium]|jgi:RHS repeat-associated protein|nr:RHS repeat-associated core domain-containing protein [Planctomycetaceae bacterium]